MSDVPPLSRDLAPPEVEAVFEAMFLVAFADDDFSDDERQRFAERVAELSGGAVAGEAFDELLATVTRELFTYGLEQRLATLPGRLQNQRQRELALEAAAEVASRDQLSKSERSMLERLGQILEIEKSVIARTLEGASRSE